MLKSERIFIRIPKLAAPRMTLTSWLFLAPAKREMARCSPEAICARRERIGESVRRERAAR
jgi:hypothetical protein